MIEIADAAPHALIDAPPIDAPFNASPMTRDGGGRRPAPEAVWAEVRAAYLAGLSAPECCRRHGVGLSALRARAAAEGWRRADQPWIPPHRLDPWDEGLELEESVGGDLDRIPFRELVFVAERRMMRAVLRGQAAEALRWRRVRQAMDEDEAEVRRFMEEDAVLTARLRQRAEADASDASDGSYASDGSDGSDASDGIFAVRSDRPEPARGDDDA